MNFFDFKSYFRKLWRVHPIKAELFLWAIVFIFAVLVVPHIVGFYLEANSIYKVNLFLFFLSYLVTLSLFFAFSSNAHELLKRSSNLLVVFGLLIPIALFVLQIVVDTSESSFSAENAIKQANQNTETFSSFGSKNITESPEKYFWKDFDAQPYIENWPYISSNYSLECKTAYIKLIEAIAQFNSINQQRKNLALEKVQAENDFQQKNFVQLAMEYSKEQSVLLRHISTLNSFTVGNCQDFKQK